MDYTTYLTRGVTVACIKLEQSARRDVTSGVLSVPVTAPAQLSATQVEMTLPRAGARMLKDTRMDLIL